MNELANKRVEIVSNCAGINNRLDTKRQTLSTSEHLFIAEAVNVDIDDTGGISRRCGRVSLSSVDSHSLFCDGGDCFVVQNRSSDSVLYRINANDSLTTVRSGLTKGAFVSYFQLGTKTYYSNGSQNGVIEDAIAAAWPDQTEHFGVTTTRTFYPAPIAPHIAFFLGCAWLVVGNTIFVSEERLPGKYDLFGKRFSFGSNVRMVRPVFGGVWVSDSTQIGFIKREDTFKAMSWIKKASVPAHEWSDSFQLHDYSRLEIPGLSATWSSDEGQCIGTADGQLIVRTKDNLVYPTGSNGATVVTEDEIINSIW